MTAESSIKYKHQMSHINLFGEEYKAEVQDDIRLEMELDEEDSDFIHEGTSSSGTSELSSDEERICDCGAAVLENCLCGQGELSDEGIVLEEIEVDEGSGEDLATSDIDEDSCSSSSDE